MLRKIGFTLLSATAFALCTPTYSVTTHALQPGITIEYNLPPEDPQVFINYMFWTVDGTCKLSTIDDYDTLHVRALAKKGKINGIPLTAGHSIDLDIHHGENLLLSADSGAKVEITNHGVHTVRAACSGA